MKINLFIRSFIVFIFMAIITPIYSLLLCGSVAIGLPLRVRYTLVLSWVNAMIEVLKKICHINYTVEGLENIPKNRNGIVLCKHQSTWETFFIPRFFHHGAIILKRELLWVPFFGWGLATIKPIAIDRSKGSNAMEQIITKGRKCLEEGRWILVFPEGTRVAVGQVGKYRLGGARLATATGYPVIPIAHNAGYLWPKNSFIKKPGTVRVVIGPLIETKNRTSEEVMTEAKNWIESTVARISEPSQGE